MSSFTLLDDGRCVQTFVDELNTVTPMDELLNRCKHLKPVYQEMVANELEKVCGGIPPSCTLFFQCWQKISQEMHHDGETTFFKILKRGYNEQNELCVFSNEIAQKRYYFRNLKNNETFHISAQHAPDSSSYKFVFHPTPIECLTAFPICNDVAFFDNHVLVSLKIPISRNIELSDCASYNPQRVDTFFSNDYLFSHAYTMYSPEIKIEHVFSQSQFTNIINLALRFYLQQFQAGNYSPSFVIYNHFTRWYQYLQYIQPHAWQQFLDTNINNNKRNGTYKKIDKKRKVETDDKTIKSYRKPEINNKKNTLEHSYNSHTIPSSSNGQNDSQLMQIIPQENNTQVCENGYDISAFFCDEFNNNNDRTGVACKNVV